MQVTTLIALLLPFTFHTYASTFRGKIEKASIERPSTNLQRQQHAQNNQDILKLAEHGGSGPLTTSPRLATGLPVDNIIFFGYRTFIGVGTHPAQLMRALIDIDWADMIIPSVNCTYCSDNLKYNSSRSSTYESNGTELQMHWGAYIWGEGFVSNDTITVGDGLHIDHQPFLEAYSSSTGPFGGADTILGLAINKPFWVDPDDPNQHQLPSPFSTLAASKTLDQNIVSIRLPHSDQDLGDILFGGTDPDLYHGNLTTHLIYPNGTENWQIETSSITLSTPDGLLLSQENLTGYTARLHTNGYPWMVLPPKIGWAVVNHTGANCTDICRGCEVPCDRVDELPHVTFDFKGGNITLTGEDYTVKTDVQWPFCGYSVRCEILIGPGREEQMEEKIIDLGSSFFRGVYGVFDYDGRSVHLAKSKHYAPEGSQSLDSVNHIKVSSHSCS